MTLPRSLSSPIMAIMMGLILPLGMTSTQAHAHADRSFTVIQISDMITGRLAAQGITTLKVGGAKRSGDDRVAVTLQTTKGETVRILMVDRHTGMPTQVPGVLALALADPHKAKHMERRIKGKIREAHIAKGSPLPPRPVLDLNRVQAAVLIDARMIRTGESVLKVGKVERIGGTGNFRADLRTAKGTYLGEFTVLQNTGRVHLRLS